MDFYVVRALTELGIANKVSDSFPSPEHLQYIELVAHMEKPDEGLRIYAEETELFEKYGLENLVSAEKFFDKLRHVSQKGTYKSASIRMDVQISTRTMPDAPDIKFHMLLETKDWQKKLNISPATTDKLLEKLLEAREVARQNKEKPYVKTD